MMGSRPQKSHRHDGASPLPLGMDASPAPLKWDGKNTIWPHDPKTGWSYCATVPTWAVIPEAQTADGTPINPTVFYRVYVGVQSPQGVTVIWPVLRRFSDFLKLYTALKSTFKRKRIPSPPPKNALLRMNSSHTLLQERRLALEDWLAALLDDIELSRSVPVAAFLELEAAARSAANTISNTEEETPPIPTPLHHQRENLWNPAGSSVASGPTIPDYASDAGCSTSGVRTPTSMSELGTEIAEIESTTDSRKQKGKLVEETQESSARALVATANEDLEAAAELQSNNSDIASEQWVPVSASEGPSDNNSLVLVSGVERRVEGLPSFEADFLKSVSVLLPADQRGNVRRVLTALQRRFEIVKADLEDLITRLNQEVAVKEFLTTKVRDLEAELDSSRRRSHDVLQQAVNLERERVTELQWELEDCRAALMNAEDALQSEKDDRSLDKTRLEAFSSELESSKKQVQQLQERVDALTRERDAIDSQARAEKRVLAKEIKTLRKTHPELKEELDTAIKTKTELEEALKADQEKQEALRNSRAGFVHEVSALRQRLQECSVDFLAKEDDKSSSDAMELLVTSDNRISLLLAEARLMAQEDDEALEIGSPRAPAISNGGAAAATTTRGAGSEAEVRKLLVDILIDNAQLRKGMNSLTRSALLTVQRRDKEALDEPIVARRSSVLNRFL